jgi:ABC-type uncharacterized transport system fused permease/ATPase subunit
VSLNEAHVELKPGERTLIEGEHGVTRAVMLRALLVIWPWGRGLIPLLDATERWEWRLTEDEKQNLAFARVLLQRPRWLVIDGALDKLEPALRRRIEAFLAGDPDTGLVNIGADSSQDGFITRRLRLVTDPPGATFRPAEHCLIPAA